MAPKGYKFDADRDYYRMAPKGYKFHEDGDYYMDFNGNVHSVQDACRSYTKAGMQCMNQIEAGRNTFCKMHNRLSVKEIVCLRKAGKSRCIYLDDPWQVKVKAIADMIADSPYAGRRPDVASSASSSYGGSRVLALPDSSTAAFGHNSLPTSGGNSFPALGGNNFPPASTPYSNPPFGVNTLPAFGVNPLPAFGVNILPAFQGHSAPAFGGSITLAFEVGKASPLGSSLSPASFGNQTGPPVCPVSNIEAFGVQRKEGFLCSAENLTWSTWLENTDRETAPSRAPFLRDTFSLRCKRPGVVPDNFEDHPYFHALMKSSAVWHPLFTMPPLASGPNPLLKASDFPELRSMGVPLLSSMNSVVRDEWLEWLDAKSQLQRYQFLHDYFQCSIRGDARKKPENIIGHLYFDQLGKLYEILLTPKI